MKRIVGVIVLVAGMVWSAAAKEFEAAQLMGI